MALDEPRDTDESFEIDGFQYIVDKTFMEKATPIKVDFLVHGFKLDCGITFEESCTSCGSSGTC